ncbi:MATE family efflux transporter [Methanococcus voltae]|uniref:Multidrug export protein MepA n=1 Tax=Methanococcus voltae (strain ATCC BAA-1334 / A3) TaxID=456320 RepID=D7DTA5_METV3|nr:MATE family efflux transporter [Methanococcus voltae]MCS3901216.1 putative MATE family efflux protein [Methanococcus voltae]
MTNYDLNTTPIPKLVIRYAVPAIIGFVINGIYTIIDGIFLGHWVGSEAIASITLSFPLKMMIISFAIMIGIGASAHISINLGRNDPEKAQNIFKNAFCILILLGVFLTFVGLLAIKPLLLSFGIEGSLLNLSLTYLSIAFIGSMGLLFNVGLEPIIRNDGFPKKAMNVMIVCALTNIVFDALFIIVFGWGVAGAAIATMMGETLGAIIFLHHFLAKKSNLKIEDITYRLKNILNFKSYDKNILKLIILTGISPFLLQFSSAIVALVYSTQFLKYGGSLYVSAYGIVIYIFITLFMTILGLCSGVQPLISYNYGAKRYDKVKNILKITGTLTLIIGIISFIAYNLFPTYLINIFNSTDIELIKTATTGLNIYSYGTLVLGPVFLIITYFQSIGDSKVSNIVSLFKSFGFLIPLLYILPMYWGVNSIWCAEPLSGFLTLIMGSFFIYKAFKYQLKE